MLKNISLYCFIGFGIVYFGSKFCVFIARKIFGGRTAQERIEEKRLREKQIEEAIPQVIDTVVL